MLALRADQAIDDGTEAVEVLCGLIEGMLRCVAGGTLEREGRIE
jgi:hypothetical protein